MVGQIADIYQARGELDKALSIFYFSGNKQLNLFTAISLPDNPHTIDEISFLSLLVASPSIEIEEKSQIIAQLSSEQIESFIEIFHEETKQFRALGDEHIEQMDRMQDKKLLEWLEWENSIAN